MKERVSSQTEAAWAYLHGELTGDERRAFEQDLQEDAALRRTFEDANQMDRLLRETLPVIDQVDISIDDVAEQALACWEKSYDSEQNSVPECISQLKQGAVRSNWYELFLHPAVGVAGLAAAAVILLASSVLRSPDGLVWEDPVFAPLTLRGALPPEEQGATLSKDTAARCQTLLQADLTHALAIRKGSVQTPLVVCLRLQELRNGAFSLSVQVRTHKGEVVGMWSGDYSGEAAFDEQVEASAAQMAEVLAFWPQTAKGDRP